MSEQIESLHENLDALARAVWLVCRDLSDLGDDALRPEDLALWGAATRHPGVQGRLAEGEQKG